MIIPGIDNSVLLRLFGNEAREEQDYFAVKPVLSLAYLGFEANAEPLTDFQGYPRQQRHT